jgi:hypothetical protein
LIFYPTIAEKRADVVASLMPVKDAEKFLKKKSEILYFGRYAA